MTQSETDRKILPLQCKFSMEVTAEYNDPKCKFFVKAPEAGENGGHNERSLSAHSSDA